MDGKIKDQIRELVEATLIIGGRRCNHVATRDEIKERIDQNVESLTERFFDLFNENNNKLEKDNKELQGYNKAYEKIHEFNLNKLKKIQEAILDFTDYPK